MTQLAPSLLNGLVLQAKADASTLYARTDVIEAELEALRRRVQSLEAPIAGVDLSMNYTWNPENVAEASAVVAALQYELIERMVRGFVDGGLLPNDVFKKELDALPQIVDRPSLTLYISQVVSRLQAKRITAPEARTLLYAAQVALQGKRVKALDDATSRTEADYEDEELVDENAMFPG